MDAKNKKDRPLYIPPSMRNRNIQSTPATDAPNPRLEVKLDIKKSEKSEKIVHAWEKEDRTVHAWKNLEKSDKVNQDFKGDSQTKKFQSKSFKKDHYAPRNSKAERLTSTNQSDSSIAKPTSKIVQSPFNLPDKPQKEDKKSHEITFIDAQQFLDEIAASDWNDPGEIDYSKVPKFKH